MRQLILIVLIVVAYLFIKKVIRDALNPVQGGGSPNSGGRPVARNKSGNTDHGEEMVQDPNCGAYVPVSRALTYRHDGKTLHFCSDGCADEYAKKLKSGNIH